MCYLINLSHRLKQILQYYAFTLFLKNNENPLKVSELPELSGLVKEIRFIFLSILLYIDRFRRFRSRIRRHLGTCCFVFFLISFPVCFLSLFSSFSCNFIPCSGYTLWCEFQIKSIYQIKVLSHSGGQSCSLKYDLV